MRCGPESPGLKKDDESVQAEKDEVGGGAGSCPTDLACGAGSGFMFPESQHQMIG